MSILVKGMEMPKDCNECPITFFSGGSRVCKFGCLKNVDCPLVEVPTPHGDLVDRETTPMDEHGEYHFMDATVVIEAEE